MISLCTWYRLCFKFSSNAIAREAAAPTTPTHTRLEDARNETGRLPLVRTAPRSTYVRSFMASNREKYNRRVQLQQLVGSSGVQPLHITQSVPNIHDDATDTERTLTQSLFQAQQPTPASEDALVGNPTSPSNGDGAGVESGSGEYEAVDILNSFSYVMEHRHFLQC